MFSQSLRRAGVLAFSLASLTISATSASALSANRQSYKDLTISGEGAATQFAREKAARAAASRTPGKLDFSRMDRRSTFSAGTQGAASAASARRAAARSPAPAPRFAAPATREARLFLAGALLV